MRFTFIVRYINLIHSFMMVVMMIVVIIIVIILLFKFFDNI